MSADLFLRTVARCAAVHPSYRARLPQLGLRVSFLSETPRQGVEL